jgi:hypothetical protein
MRKPVVVACLALLATLVSTATASAAPAPCTATKQTARAVTVKVAGDKTKGFAAMPKKAPRGLVVVAPGYSYTAAAWKSKLKLIASGSRTVAVAATYRGLREAPPINGIPKSRGIPLRNGIADVIGYGKAYARKCTTVKTVVLVGYSTGGIYSGNALMRKPKRGSGQPLFDYFVGMEAMSDVFKEFELAKALPDDVFVQGAVADAAAELGGTIDENPAAYHAVNPIEHVDRIKASGLKGVFLVHGVDDGLVPYTQSTDMRTALRDAGVKAELISAQKRRPGDVPDTTLSGRFGTPSGNSGHAPDWSVRHLVPETGLKVIRDIVRSGRKPINRDIDVGATS